MYGRQEKERKFSLKKVYVTADTHLGHGNIVKYCNRNIYLTQVDKDAYEANGNSWHRGDWKGEGSSQWRISREAVEAMDDDLINNINNFVGEDDILYHLGDFCFAPKDSYFRVAANYRRRINCREVHFIFGNHDGFEIGKLFSTAFNLNEIRVHGTKFILCHYALAVWNGSHRGSIQLYGHSHSNLEGWIDKAMPGHRSMDVGVDNAYKILGMYRPFSIEEIIKIMDSRKGFSSDHHGMRKGPTEEELIG